MRELTVADFTALRGRPVRVDAANGSVELVVGDSQILPGGTRAGGGFRVEFQGPLHAVLPQGTYAFHVGSPPSQIFIVPIGPGEGVMRYEAIFY